ncbi:MAG: aminopeptidase P family N-terminal domain-containing protein [Enterocloster sp.]
MTTNEKLSLLREKMAEAGVQAYLIPSSDPHISEYLPDHWRTRAWLSGFDGSAGTLVVTETESGLWTDGRYFIQAERQMAGSEIVLYRMREKDVPTIQEFLLSRLKEGEVLGTTAWSLPLTWYWIWRQHFLPRGSGSGLRI